MKWAYRIRRKISAAMLLAAIFVLVFVKNMVENEYVSELGDSFASVYEDRLVVESYVYRLSDNLFRKKIILDTCSIAHLEQARAMVDRHNAAIAGLIVDYEKTKLTPDEAATFAELKVNLGEMQKLEDEFFRAIADRRQDRRTEAIAGRFAAASENLAQLSTIQLKEGKLLNEQSRQIVAESSLLTQFELGILVAISLMIFVLVFESTSIFAKPAGKESLN